MNNNNVYSIRMPGTGSYPNIESRDSPVGGSCNYVNETTAGSANAAVATAVAAAQASMSSEPKLIYKKSVFKKKSTSSTATVSKTYIRVLSQFNYMLLYLVHMYAWHLKCSSF